MNKVDKLNIMDLIQLKKFQIMPFDLCNRTQYFNEWIRFLSIEQITQMYVPSITLIFIAIILKEMKIFSEFSVGIVLLFTRRQIARF